MDHNFQTLLCDFNHQSSFLFSDFARYTQSRFPGMSLELNCSSSLRTYTHTIVHTCTCIHTHTSTHTHIHTHTHTHTHPSTHKRTHSSIHTHINLKLCAPSSSHLSHSPLSPQAAWPVSPGKFMAPACSEGLGEEHRWSQPCLGAQEKLEQSLQVQTRITSEEGRPSSDHQCLWYWRYTSMTCRIVPTHLTTGCLLL